MKRIAAALCASTIAVTAAGCQFSEPSNRSAELDPAKPTVETRTKAGARQVVVDVVTSIRTRDARTLCASLAPDAKRDLIEDGTTDQHEAATCEQVAQQFFRDAGDELHRAKIVGPVKVAMLSETTARVEFKWAQDEDEVVTAVYRDGRWLMSLRDPEAHTTIAENPDGSAPDAGPVE